MNKLTTIQQIREYAESQVSICDKQMSHIQATAVTDSAYKEIKKFYQKILSTLPSYAENGSALGLLPMGIVVRLLRLNRRKY